MRVRLAKPARQELLSIWEYVAMDNPLAATKLTQRITDACRRLGRFTKLGKPGRSDDTRELGVSGTPYVVVYRVLRTEVRVLRILHGSRKWPRTGDSDE